MRTLLPIFQNNGERCPDLVPGEAQVLCIQLSAFFLRLSAILRHAPPPKSDFKRFFQLRSTLGAYEKAAIVSQRDLTCNFPVPNRALQKAISDADYSVRAAHQKTPRASRQLAPRVLSNLFAAVVGAHSKNTVRTQVADVALTHAVATAGGL